MAIDRDSRRVGAPWRRDRAATAAVGGIHPAVGAGAEAIDAELLVAGLKPGEDHLAGLGRAVAVAVDKVENVGGSGDEQPAIPRQETVGEREPRGEDRPGVDRPVAVGVGEHDDPSAAVAVGIVAHLGDEQPAVVIPADRHRIEDERLGRHELHHMPRHHLEAGLRIGRGKRPRRCGGAGGSPQIDRRYQPECQKQSCHVHRADPPPFPCSGACLRPSPRSSSWSRSSWFTAVATIRSPVPGSP